MQECLDELKIVRDDWSLEASKPEEIPSRIAGTGAGLVVAMPAAGGWSVWPIKFGEYLAAGIPVVVEKGVGEHITNAVTRWKLGMVIEACNPESYRGISEVFEHREAYSERCIAYARKKLTISHSTAQYARLYRQLLNK